MTAIDLTDDGTAKLHIRHLLGGYAASGNLAEAVFWFEFPERRSAFLQFFRELPDDFKITMVHYRHHRADVGRLLVRFRSVRKGDPVRFEEKLGALFASFFGRHRDGRVGAPTSRRHAGSGNRFSSWRGAHECTSLEVVMDRGNEIGGNGRTAKLITKMKGKGQSPEEM